MTQQISYNCIVCAKECSSEELHGVALSHINVTKFKICESCLNLSDPSDDYREVKNIVNSYLKVTEAKQLFIEAQHILDSLKK